MCKECFSDGKIATKTTFTVELKDCILVVKNVPCMECPVCGEVLFGDDVSAKLEKIVEKAKHVIQEVSVVDFNKVA